MNKCTNCNKIHVGGKDNCKRCGRYNGCGDINCTRWVNKCYNYNRFKEIYYIIEKVLIKKYQKRGKEPLMCCPPTIHSKNIMSNNPMNTLEKSNNVTKTS